MKVIKQIITPTKKCHIQCDCGGDHYLQFLIFERMISGDDYPEVDNLYITMGASKISFWRDRIRIMWNILRYGEFENHGIIANRKEIEKLINYLKDVLKYWDENYKDEKNKHS